MNIWISQMKKNNLFLSDPVFIDQLTLMETVINVNYSTQNSVPNYMRIL